jgi:excisionase family DNA binding protein
MTSLRAPSAVDRSRGSSPVNPTPPVHDVVGREAQTPILVPLAVSPRRAAEYLGVGHDAIYQLLNQGRLRSVKLGRRRLIPLSELERFLSDEMT